MIPVFSLFLLITILLISKSRFTHPIFAIFLPISMSWILYSLQLSRFYWYNSSGVILIFISFAFFIIGFVLSYPNSNCHKIEFRKYNVSVLKLKHTIQILTVITILVFVLESIIVKPPLLSESPTKNYMEFGLPILHHFISLYKIIGFLTVLYYLKTKRKFLLIFCFIIAITMYTLLLARMMIINYIVIILISFIILRNKRINIKQVSFISILACFFLALFIVLGELRLAGVGEEYLRTLSGVYNNNIPSSLVLPYIYFSVSNQNMLLLIENFSDFDFGLGILSSLLPVVDINIFETYAIKNFQVSDGLTTFTLGASAFKSFGYFYPLFFLFLGGLVSYFYRKSSKNLSFQIFYVTFLYPVLVFSFFSDSLLSTSFLIFLVSSIGIGKFLRN